MRKRFLVVIISLALCWIANADELFRIAFSGRCFPSTGTNGLTTKLTGTDLIRRCVGSDVTRRQIRRNYRVAYNASADSLQIIKLSDDSLVCDVFRFETSASAMKSNRLDRLAFVLNPRDGRFIGTAIFTERPLTNTANGTLRARITARLQFAEERNINASTNASNDFTNSAILSNVAVSATSLAPTTLSVGSFAQPGVLAVASENIEVCTATLTIGRLLVSVTNQTGQTSITDTNQTASDATNQTNSPITNQTGLATNITTIPGTNNSTIPGTNNSTIPAPPPPP